MDARAHERNEAEDLYAHRNDAEEWDEEPADVEVRPKRTEVVSFRLPSDELDDLQAAAGAADESLSEYIRTAIAARMRGGVVIEAAIAKLQATGVGAGGPRPRDVAVASAQWVAHVGHGQWAPVRQETDAVDVPDYPAQFQQMG